MDLIDVTKQVKKADGTHALILKQARLCVVRGPDDGLDCRMDRTRVVVGSGAECDVRLSDPAVSRQHLELCATEGGYRIRDLGSTNGTRIGGVRLQEGLVDRSTTIEIRESELTVSPTPDTVEIPLSARRHCGKLIAKSIRMRQVFALLERVAPTNSTVLIEGESGTGKDLAAQSIHQASNRRDQPFVVVDCGAIAPSLVESELFGHERGAFTGANSARKGALEEADGGTLFLDEVAELPADLQPRPLRFVESQQSKRVGATQHTTVNVRVIAATNRHLIAEVEAGRFRQDLYFRLAVVRVELPPLRDRPDDILLLAHHLAQSHVEDSAALITDEIAALLTAYHWPGNVRELRNVIERLALLPEVAAATLRATLPSQDADRPLGRLALLPFHEARRQWQDLFERKYLELQLARAEGVIAEAARRSELPRQTFHRLLSRHEIKASRKP